MKKIMNKVNFALIGLMVTCPALAAQPGKPEGICALIEKFQGLFGWLRTLAFVGAAFYIAGWAWGYISKGEAKIEDVKKQGIGLLVGFALLFSIGLVLTFLLGMNKGTFAGCATEITTGW